MSVDPAADGVIEESELSPEYWCTSGDVTNKIQIPLGSKQPNVTESIDSATDSVQAWVIRETAYSADTLPTVDSFASKPNSLLQTATAYQAASEEHEKRTESVKSDEQSTPKYVFLERRAKSKFEEWLSWVREEGLDSDGETSESRLKRTGGYGRSSSLMPSRADYPTYQSNPHHGGW